jgi:tetratricopeptide (TPR) repeat protein
LFRFRSSRWTDLGTAWIKKGEDDKAIEYFEKALMVLTKTFGDNHQLITISWDGLGVAWREKGEYDKAIEYFENNTHTPIHLTSPG